MRQDRGSIAKKCVTTIFVGGLLLGGSSGLLAPAATQPVTAATTTTMRPTITLWQTHLTLPQQAAPYYLIKLVKKTSDTVDTQEQLNQHVRITEHGHTIKRLSLKKPGKFTLHYQVKNSRGHWSLVKTLVVTVRQRYYLDAKQVQATKRVVLYRTKSLHGIVGKYPAGTKFNIKTVVWTKERALLVTTAGYYMTASIHRVHKLA